MLHSYSLAEAQEVTAFPYMFDVELLGVTNM